MPIPSFSDTLSKTLGPGITIIRDGNVFENNKTVEESGLSLEKMNEELAKSTGGANIFFMPAENPREDTAFTHFLKTREKTGAL